MISGPIYWLTQLKSKECRAFRLQLYDHYFLFSPNGNCQQCKKRRQQPRRTAGDCSCKSYSATLVIKDASRSTSALVSAKRKLMNHWRRVETGQRHRVIIDADSSVQFWSQGKADDFKKQEVTTPKAGKSISPFIVHPCIVLCTECECQLCLWIFMTELIIWKLKHRHCVEIMRRGCALSTCPSSSVWLTGVGPPRGKDDMSASERENKREPSGGETGNINLPTAEERKSSAPTQECPRAISGDQGSALFEGKGYRACLFSLEGKSICPTSAALGSHGAARQRARKAQSPANLFRPKQNRAGDSHRAKPEGRVGTAR